MGRIQLPAEAGQGKLPVNPITDLRSTSGVDWQQSKYNVISVSNSASFVTTPLLPSVVSGQLNHRDIIEPLRSASDVSFYHAWAEAVDFDKQVVTCIPASKPVYRGKDPLVKEQQRDARAEAVPVDRDYKVGYDKLVIATGCYNQTFGTPGVKENA